MSRLLVFTAVGKSEDAEWISREVVERGLAACVNILPSVTSVYRWKGEVEKSDEVLLLIKTTGERFEALREALVSMHSYEVIAVQIDAGHLPFLAWLDELGAT